MFLTIFFFLIGPADNIPFLRLDVVEVSNHSYGIVKISWDEPINPNGLIVTYQIEYRHVDIENVSTNFSSIYVIKHKAAHSLNCSVINFLDLKTLKSSFMIES